MRSRAGVITSPGLLIVEQTDPERLSPGGIDSIIRDIVRFSKCPIYIVGVSQDRTLGKWARIDFAGRQIGFLPVARLDRRKIRGLPHSLLVGIGLLRHRRKVPRLYAHTHRVELGVAYSLIARGLYAQFVHNDIPGLLGPNSDSFWRRLPRVYRALEARAVSKADATVCFSAGATERLGARFAGVRRQLSWVDPDLFFPRAKDHPRSSRKAGPGSGGGVKIAWVGRMDYQKDPLLAIAVVEHLVATGIKVELTMAGVGPLLETVQREAALRGVSSAIRTRGALSRESVAELLRDSDMLLLTSHYEGSPVVVAEAGAAGLPIVAPTEADPDGVVVDGVNGWRVRDRRVASFAAAIANARSVDSDRCVAAAKDRVAPVMVSLLPGLAGVQ